VGKDFELLSCLPLDFDMVCLLVCAIGVTDQDALYELRQVTAKAWEVTEVCAVRNGNGIDYVLLFVFRDRQDACAMEQRGQ